MLGLFLFLLFIIVASVIIAKISFWVATRMIIFARAAVVLFIALLLSKYGPLLVPNQGFINFLIWAVICFGIVFLLSLLPRVDLSTRFSCTLAISFIVMELVVALLGVLLGKTFELVTAYEIITKVVCLGVSLFVIFSQECKIASNSPAWFVVRFFDRLLASLFYGISFLLMCSSTHGNWQLTLTGQFIVLIVSIVGTFIADILLFPQLTAKIQAKVNEIVEVDTKKANEDTSEIQTENEKSVLERTMQAKNHITRMQSENKNVATKSVIRDKNGLIANISRLAKQKDRYTYIPTAADVPYDEYLKARSANKNRCATCGDKIGYRSILGYQHAYYHKGAYYCFLCYEKEEYAEQMSTLRGRIEYYLTPDDDWD